MRTRDQEEFQRKKIMLMEKCYDCYAENGLASVGIRKLAESCGCSSAVLYIYFRDLDDLIVQSTAYCMKKVEDDFMAKAPTDPQDLMRFIDEIPYWTARQHGKKYRLMYQVYTHPKYIRYGKQFFEGVNRRYTEYAKSLEPKLGIPYTTITPLIFILIQTCVHYAMFEDECYLQSQLEALARDVAQMRADLKQAGKKRGLSVSPPSLETALSVLIWLALILLGTLVGMVVLRTIWSGLAALWSAVRTLIP